MALTQVNRGTSPNDNTASTLYDAFGVVNSNATSLDTSITTSSDSTFNNVKVGRGNGNHITNTMLGYATGLVNTSTYNTFLGTDCGLQNTSGSYNTIVGSEAGYNNTTGASNTFLGSYAGNTNSTGINNTFIGTNAGNTSNFNNCSVLGESAQVTADAQLQLGKVGVTTFVYGTVQSRSDLRDKTEVRDTVLGLDFINELRPVDYKWDMRESYREEMPIKGNLSDEDFKIVMDAWLESVKLDNITHDGTHKRNRYHHGLIAQEVQDVIEASGVDFGGFQDHKINGGQDVLSLGYDELIAPMIKAIQELTARINILEGN